MQFTLKYLLVVLKISIALGAAMFETSIDSFEPDPNIADDYITLGTLRVTRKKRNSYIIVGDFELQQNWGNENVVWTGLNVALFCESNESTLHLICTEKTQLVEQVCFTLPVIKTLLFLNRKVSYSLEATKNNGSPLLSGRKKFCDFLNMDSSIIDRIRAVSNLPAKGTCPVPKGKYQIDQFELTEDMLPPVLPKGQYVLNARMDDVEGRQIMAYKVFATVK